MKPAALLYMQYIGVAFLVFFFAAIGRHCSPPPPQAHTRAAVSTAPAGNPLGFPWYTVYCAADTVTIGQGYALINGTYYATAAVAENEKYGCWGVVYTLQAGAVERPVYDMALCYHNGEPWRIVFAYRDSTRSQCNVTFVKRH